ncbi:MAG: NYN domain-containing protein, partial [Planctomycetes bacterium]|nr:NYN domain-containing protein [Planctomycetota bacterium]
MKSHRAGDGERTLAVFIDFENMGLGFNNRRDRFEIGKVLERLVEKGKIVCKKAYADWSRFGMYTGALHEAAIELIEIPRRGITGKNSADIRLVVDAIDLAYSKDHIDTFVIVSGDSDFSPLVSKLKELGKHVIGLGLSDATSDLLRDNCDEFMYYEDLGRSAAIPVSVDESIPEKKRKLFALVLDTLLALRRENKEIIYSSMLKDTIKRKKPSFNEGFYGYRTFSELLEDAQRDGLLELEKHKTSGMYVVARFGSEMKSEVRSGPTPVPPTRVVQLPARVAEPKKAIEAPRPAAAEPVAPPPRRAAAPPPAKPAPMSPPAPDADDDRPLGRALVEDFDALDEDDVPSYGPKKPVAREAKPAAKPPAREAKPKEPAPRSARPAKPAPAERPPARKPEQKPAPKPAPKP